MGLGDNHISIEDNLCYFLALTMSCRVYCINMHFSCCCVKRAASNKLSPFKKSESNKKQNSFQNGMNVRSVIHKKIESEHRVL